VSDGECEHAVEDVDSDLAVGPVEHRGEPDDVRIFELPEAAFDLGLGAVAGHDVGEGPVVAVGDQDPFAEDLLLQLVCGRPGPG
jgi:hypothetical protein